MLSFSGRLQLISAVIYSLVNFWFAAFVLPKSCLRKIESLCNGFLWAGDIGKRTNAKVSWKDCCLPKREGGLGLRDFSTWNKTMNLKLVWLLYSSSGSLWVAWLKRHKLHSSVFWSVEERQGDSWTWRLMLRLRPLAKRFISCIIADGRNASYWFDSWCPIGPLMDILGENGPMRTGIGYQATVSQACDGNGWFLPSHRTRHPSLALLRTTLLRITPPTDLAGSDVYFWGLGTSKKIRFNSKTTWEGIRPSGEIKQWFKAVWFTGSVPKHSFTFWVANLNRLPVRSRMASWGIQLDPTCCLCNQFEETRDHLFLQCEYTVQIWRRVLLRLGLPPAVFNDWNSLITFMLTKPLTGMSSMLRKLAIQAVIFYVWKERNGRCHASPPATATCVFTQLDRALRDNFLANRQRKLFSTLFCEWNSFV